MMIPYKSVRAKENLFCGACNAFIGEGDMYLFDEESAERGEKDAILCHFCNYKRQKESLTREKEQQTAQSAEAFKEKVNRLDDLVARALNKKLSNGSE